MSLGEGMRNLFLLVHLWLSSALFWASMLWNRRPFGLNSGCLGDLGSAYQRPPVYLADKAEKNPSEVPSKPSWKGRLCASFGDTKVSPCVLPVFWCSAYCGWTNACASQEFMGNRGLSVFAGIESSFHCFLSGAGCRPSTVWA